MLRFGHKLVLKLLFCASFVFVLLVSAGVTAYRIAEPAWEGSHQGYNLSIYGRHVNNLQRYGYLGSKAGMIQTWGLLPDPDPLPRYVTHPLLNVTSMFLSSRLLGGGDWALRFPVVLSSVLSVFLLSALAFRSGGAVPGLLAGFVAALVPIRAEYGRMPDPPILAAFFVVAAVYSYCVWTDSRRREWLVALVAAVVLGCLSDWNAYFVVPPILVHYLIKNRGARDLRFPFILIGAVVACMAGHIAWVLWNQGPAGLSALRSQFLFRFASEGYADAYVFTPLEYFETLRARSVNQITPVVIGGSLLWLLSFLFRARRRVSRRSDDAILISLTAWLSYVLVFSNVSMIHDYHMLYGAVPFFALSFADSLSALVERLRGGPRVIYALLIVALLWLFVCQSLASLREYHRQPLHTQEVTVGQALNARTADADVLLFGSAPPYPRMRYYLDRQFRVVTDLQAFKAELASASTAPLYVLSPQSEVSDDLRRYLFEHYAVDQLESYSVFDLSSSSGNTLQVEMGSSDVPVLDFDAPLQLLSISLSPEMVAPAPEPSWWQRFLNAHADLLPENQTRVAVDFVWQAKEQPAQDYSVVLKLVHSLTHETAVEMRRQPLSGTFPTSMWREGDIVSERFDVSLPSSAAPGRYRLELELVDTKGKRIAGTLDSNRSWPDVRLAPSAPDVPVKVVPEACRSAETTDDAASVGVAGWCADAEALELYWQISESSDQDFLATLVLSSEGLIIEQKVDLLLATTWQVGRIYHLRVPFAPGLLPAPYDARLRLRGDALPDTAAGISLGTIDVEGEAPLLVRRLGQPNAAAETGLRLEPKRQLTIEYPLAQPQDMSLTIAWPGLAELPETRVQLWLENDIWVWQPKLLGTIVVGSDRPQRTVMEIPERLTVAGMNRITVEVADAGEAYLGWRRLAVTLVPNLRHFLRDSYQPYTGWVDIDYMDVSLASKAVDREDLLNVSSTFESLGLFSRALDLVDAAIGEAGTWTLEEQVTRARLHAGMEDEEAAATSYRSLLAAVLDRDDLSRDDMQVLIEALYRMSTYAKSPAEVRSYQAALGALVPNHRPELLGGTVWYLGHELVPQGDGLAMTVYLLPIAALDRDYAIWMHAKPDDQSALPEDRKEHGSLNLDHVPTVPTTSWMPYRLYVDERKVQLAEACYAIDLGFWDNLSGERLLTAEGGLGVVLGEECVSAANRPQHQTFGTASAARVARSLGLDDTALKHYRVLARDLDDAEAMPATEEGRRLIESLANIALLTDDSLEKREADSKLAELVPGYAPISLGESVLYLGYDTIPAPGRLAVGLYFLPLTPMEEGFRIWMHATPKRNQVLPEDRREAGFLNMDHDPVLDTARWSPGVLYVDETDVALEPACYELRFGLWRSEDRVRLLTPNGDIGLSLGEVCVDEE